MDFPAGFRITRCPRCFVVTLILHLIDKQCSLFLIDLLTSLTKSFHRVRITILLYKYYYITAQVLLYKYYYTIHLRINCDLLQQFGKNISISFKIIRCGVVYTILKCKIVHCGFMIYCITVITY